MKFVVPSTLAAYATATSAWFGYVHSVAQTYPGNGFTIAWVVDSGPMTGTLAACTSGRPAVWNEELLKPVRPTTGLVLIMSFKQAIAGATWYCSSQASTLILRPRMPPLAFWALIADFRPSANGICVDTVVPVWSEINP